MTGPLASAPYHRIRYARYDRIYVSPHLDDAVYSCGGQIALARAAGHRVLLLTLFGTGGDHVSKPGIFGDLPQRKREERAAANVLDVDFLFANAPDVLFRRKAAKEMARYALPPLRLPESDLRRELRAFITAACEMLLAPEGLLYFPLAVGAHPDHRETYELGRALHAERPTRVRFYEDIPYAHVGALREARLRELAVSSQGGGLLADAGEIAGFVFAHSSALARSAGRLPVAAHRAAVSALLWLGGSRDPIGPFLRLEEHDVTAAIDLKVAAMRAYATQTAFFFPPGEAIYDVLVKRSDRYVERTWTLAPAGADARTPLDDAAYARAKARVSTLERPRSN